MTDFPHQSESSQELSLLLGDRYQLLRQIGEGGTSQVYEAQHQLTGETVALKIIPLKRVGDQKTIARFLREAKLTQGLSHPGFVQIQDAWIDSNQRCCLVMERLYGSSLRELTCEQNLSRSEALNMIMSVLDPLEIAHKNGIIHRDLKPENIFVHTPDKVPSKKVIKLLDFGLSRSVLSPTVTHTGQFVGTPWYISPEQAFSPKQCEASSDIWSIGVILYELLCDQVPFEGESLPMICMSIKQDQHRPVTELNPLVHSELAELIDRCLSKNPDVRPQNAGELKQEFLKISQYFINREGATVISSGAIRGTPATLDIDSADIAQVLGQGSESLVFGETIDHDTSTDVGIKKLESIESNAGFTLRLSSDEIAERLQEFDEKLSQEQLELGPTAIGTLKAIDWPDEEEKTSTEPNQAEFHQLEPHALDTESMTARDDLLNLIQDPIESNYLDSEAVTYQKNDEQEKIDTLRGAPQAMWTSTDIVDDILEASDVISVIKELDDQYVFLPSSSIPIHQTEALSSKHGPPPTLLGTPHLEDSMNIHDEETSINMRDKIVEVNPQLAQAVTHRKIRSPYVQPTLDYHESEITPILEDPSQIPKEIQNKGWSRPIKQSERTNAQARDLTQNHYESDDFNESNNPNTLLWISTLIFIAALAFALWSARFA